MKQAIANVYKVFLSALAVFLLAFLGYAYFAPHASVAFHQEAAIPFNTGWQYSADTGDHGTTALPARVKLPPNAQLILTQQLPQALPVPTVLGFRSSQQRVRVSLEGEVLYTFGQDAATRAFGKSSGSAWNLVRLPSGCEGKTIQIELTSPYSTYSGMMSEMHLGTKAALLFHILLENLPSLLVSLVVLAIGLALTALYLLLSRKSKGLKALLYLGIFSIDSAVWMLSETRLVQFFSDNLLFALTLTFLSMLCIPLTVVKYISTIEHFGYPGFLRFIYALFCVHIAVVFTLQALNIADFVEMLPYIHGVLLVACIAVLLLLVLDFVRNRNAFIRPILLSLLLLLLFSALEIFQFYYFSKMRRAGLFVQLGALTFISVQAFWALRRAREVLRLSQEAEYYALMATRDSLTRCLNRRAYDLRRNDLTQLEGISAVQADINSLKVINDTFGHEMGDDAIIRCAHCFQSIFSAYGECYRTGGDEFLFLGRGLEEEALAGLQETFQAACAAISPQVVYPFHVACGHALYSAATDHALTDTVHRADLQMYDHKCKMKNSDT